MTNEERVQLRANIMGGMNEYILNTVDDEMLLDYWFEMGLPDEVTEDMLMEYAEDEELFDYVICAFEKIISSLVGYD